MINPFLTKPNYIRIYGHRGARGDIVENSISGFKYTFDLGIKAVEFDVVISKDNIPTIFHDYRLNPDLVKDASGNWITDKSMKLVELTYEEISKYSIGSIKPETKYAKRFKNQKPITGEKIPKLTDFFKLVTEDKYKDVFLEAEKEYSAYNFENANTESLLKSFEFAEKESKSLVEQKLVLPAYDQCLKASHLFNLLDARGVISVAERTGYINRIRELAKTVGSAWLEKN